MPLSGVVAVKAPAIATLTPVSTFVMVPVRVAPVRFCAVPSSLVQVILWPVWAWPWMAFWRAIVYPWSVLSRLGLRSVLSAVGLRSVAARNTVTTGEPIPNAANSRSMPLLLCPEHGAVERARGSARDGEHIIGDRAQDAIAEIDRQRDAGRHFGGKDQRAAGVIVEENGRRRARANDKAHQAEFLPGRWRPDRDLGRRGGQGKGFEYDRRALEVPGRAVVD